MKFKDQFYLILAGIFIASLVTCNLIANKFVTVDLGFKVFIVSAGILPYPLTFLVTDLISELYGQKTANLVVFSGFIASLFVLLFLWLGAQPDALNRMEIKTNSDNKIDLKLIENLSKVDFLKLESTDQNTAIFDIKSHVEMNDEEVMRSIEPSLKSFDKET